MGAQVMTIPEHTLEHFNLLIAAAQEGKLRMLRMIDPEGEPAFVLCIEEQDEDDEVRLTLMCRMLDGDQLAMPFRPIEQRLN
jgi:hypothetical protein